MMPANRQRKKHGRAAGIVLPVASLPTPYGIGDFGPAARRFVDWLQLAEQKYWEILPLDLPDGAGSPYATSSSRALNWQLISPDILVQQGWIKKWDSPHTSDHQQIDYRTVARAKWKMIKQAHTNFLRSASAGDRRSLQKFAEQQSEWLGDFAAYAALKEKFHQIPWWQWPSAWRSYKLSWTKLIISPKVTQNIYIFAQWVAHQQWQRLRAYAHRRGIKIIGDMPFYVRADSVDVWSRPELFDLDQHRRPKTVSGVPPDKFNRDGQRWGEPTYRWSAHQRTKFYWWRDRMRRMMEHYDLVRFDHFKGLIAIWAISARRSDAKHGRWVRTPGAELLLAIHRLRPRPRLIAEDLGPQPGEVDNLRRKYHIPGVRTLYFGWSGWPDNPHRPLNVQPDNFFYSSLHDTNTIMGWWRDEATAVGKRQVNARLGRNPRAIDFIRLTYQTLTQVAMIPLADALGLGSEARLNRPGTRRGNWNWRFSWRLLTRAKALQLRRVVYASRD